MRTIRFLLLLVLPLAAPLHAQEDDTDPDRYRPVRAGLLLQANLAGEQMYIAEAVLSAYPGSSYIISAYIRRYTDAFGS